MLDLTGDYEYERLIEEEKTHYSEIEVTVDLKEGGVHANEAWAYYWEGVARRLGELPGSNIPVALEQLRSSSRPIRVLSLGSGYCGVELELAGALRQPYEITCTDINEEIFSEARQRATEMGLSLDFRTADLNFIEIEPGKFDLILAHASLHHVINLERLFDQVLGGLAPSGIFHVVEVLGRNRRLIWDENEQFANALLDLLPAETTQGVRLDVPFETDGMEGVRQEDILPLIRERFRSLVEVRHGAFMRFICTDPQLGPALDPRNPATRAMIDFLIECDDSAVRHGILRPLEIWGIYRPVVVSG